MKRHVDLNVSQNWLKPQNNCMLNNEDWFKTEKQEIKGKGGERKSSVTDNHEEKKSNLMIK